MSSTETRATARRLTATAKANTTGRVATTSQGPYSFRVVLRDLGPVDFAAAAFAVQAIRALDEGSRFTATWGRDRRGLVIVNVTDETAREAVVRDMGTARAEALAKALAESPAATPAELAYDGGRTAQAAADLRAGQVPAYTVEEAREVEAAGLSLVATVSGGQRAHEVRDRSGRHLGRVAVVTEELGRGVWHHFAAYRPDGSRVGYGDSRVAAAELLRGEPAEVARETTVETWGPDAVAVTREYDVAPESTLMDLLCATDLSVRAAAPILAYAEGRGLREAAEVAVEDLPVGQGGAILAAAGALRPLPRPARRGPATARRTPPPSPAEASEAARRRTLGDMDEEERAEAVRGAVVRFQAELTAAAPALAAALDADGDDARRDWTMALVNDGTSAGVRGYAYRVRRGGEELGTVRRERGMEERWEASDSDGVLRVLGEPSRIDAAAALVDGIDRRAASAEAADGHDVR